MEVQECVMYGSIRHEHEHLLRQRLEGLCDPNPRTFTEEEWPFELNFENKTVIRLRMRRSIDKTVAKIFQLRYVGAAEPDPQCPTIVRKTVDSLVQSEVIMPFMKELGLRNTQGGFHYIIRGVMYTKGKMKVLLQQICKMPQHQQNPVPEPIVGATLVELNLPVAPGQDYRVAAKTVKEFADQLKPLLTMEKIDPNSITH